MQFVRYWRIILQWDKNPKNTVQLFKIIKCIVLGDISSGAYHLFVSMFTSCLNLLTYLFIYLFIYILDRLLWSCHIIWSQQTSYHNSFTILSNKLAPHHSQVFLLTCPTACFLKTVLTHLPLDKMAAILRTIFSSAFSWMKSLVFLLKFHWSLFLRVQLIITQHWFR